ncbi:histidine--tRNA ligase [Flammeovirga yaeyamensis]|uniref:Histidine--tRNA ligase n=1 Tax=Flammeovirga yaeyamensis TaxID=367791 RepID=A0AAX1MY29_9BACT|nr:histidine--tRNA ligase [Flammeovirga yaeyamensis]MBB3696352.1 histidyl-tRNA synthetase [Flammeovirga yaeyamensis]NMF35031.1 histidine--tRNA ligase [Flammeovirga yaeyamensis]QWG00145.1 histidine--tRNA ligase [Flammeovirga yaeyamensis]
MAKQKPTVPKGTRDFGPEQMAKRTYILDTIKSVYKKYGFQNLETPTMENLSVLTGKYGDEGDQLLFKVVNSGDYLKKVKQEDFEQGAKHMLPKISEKGLRYDLTVPFARYVVMNHGNLSFPFKRYQVQPVWRADRPQRGRYREFYQCDADVVGTDSLLCEAEILAMMGEALTNLKVTDHTIKLNNRKVLTGIAEAIGENGKESELCVAIDKLDKIGVEKVNLELTEQRGFTQEAVDQLAPIYEMSGTTEERIAKMKDFLASSEVGLKGLEELEEVFNYTSKLGVNTDKVEFDVTLARGLSYYTGAIFEVKVNNANMGSISGGGRYDNLTGVFGLEGMSGVGFSFGVDRIYDVLEELDLYPESAIETTKVMLTNFDNAGRDYSLPLLQQLRNAGISAELYPDNAKMKKQMNFANRKNIQYVVLAWEDEMSQGKYSLKNMETGEQEMLSGSEIVEKLRN